jgi:UDP-N-acetyl-D-glucosamine dehydrogenase
VLEESGLAAGTDFHLALSHDLLDSRRTGVAMRNTPRVVAGMTQECANLAQALFGLVCDRVIQISTPTTAEPIGRVGSKRPRRRGRRERGGGHAHWP